MKFLIVISQVSLIGVRQSQDIEGLDSPLSFFQVGQTTTDIRDCNVGKEAPKASIRNHRYVGFYVKKEKDPQRGVQRP